MDREARIKLIAEGAQRAAGDFRQVAGEVSGLGKAASTAEKQLKQVAASVFHAASDFARAANDVKPISFQASADNAKRFEDSVTRLAVRTTKDVGTLKTQFRDVAKEIGVVPQRAADAARALTKATGSNDAAAALSALGVEANETDRSLEEMAELGATLYSKLGVPMDKIGDAIRKARTAAADFSTVGGHMALEDTLVRLGPQLARVGGGVSRSLALVAALGRGKSKEVAEETTTSVLATLDKMPRLLVAKAMRQETKQHDYKPYEVDASGREVLKPEVPAILQRRLKRLPEAAGYNLFGGDTQAYHAFMGVDWKGVTTEELRLELEGDLRADAETARRPGLQHRRASTAPSRLAGVEKLVLAPGSSGSRFAATTAGRRARTDAERADVELEVGDFVQGQRDKRNDAYAGHRGAQAAVDTVKAYLPSGVERALDLVEAVGVEAKSRSEGRSPSITSGAGAAPLPVRLDSTSLEAIRAAARGQAPAAGRSPAAQAVEDNKARNRGSLSY